MQGFWSPQQCLQRQSKITSQRSDTDGAISLAPHLEGCHLGCLHSAAATLLPAQPDALLQRLPQQLTAGLCADASTRCTVALLPRHAEGCAGLQRLLGFGLEFLVGSGCHRRLELQRLGEWETGTVERARVGCMPRGSGQQQSTLGRRQALHCQQMQLQACAATCSCKHA